MDALQHIVVLPRETIAEINPFLHGHFAEHLGELIYPGICVPPDCAIPNTGGIRNDVVEALKPLGIPILRWPGGCFADDYHWRDGIGPREQRPQRLNVHWGMAPESNHFGTHEFMAFCRAIGAEPYFAGNLGSGTPQELRDWVEYCNYGGESALAEERRANGDDTPFGIRFWGIGNENWGCGGHMSAEEYAAAFSRYRTFVFNHSGTKVDAIACGPNGYEWGWTRRFFESLKAPVRFGGPHRAQGFAAHYYCGTAGSATEYTEEQWTELLAKAKAVDGIITGHRAIMDEYDPERKIQLILDEWGAWHPVEQGKPGSGLYQQNTIRDACVAALSLDVFHSHADKLYMANIAQLINVLQALLLVEEDQCIRTPTYHVFDLYRAHQGGMAVRLLSAAEALTGAGTAAAEEVRRCYTDRNPPALRVVEGSASVKEGILTVTVVNSHPTEAVELEMEIHHGRLPEAEVVTLAAPGGDIRAHNTFARPDHVTLGASSTLSASAGAGAPRVTLPPASVTRIQGRLG